MTTIITRVFDDQQAAAYARERIIFRGIPSRAITIIGPSEGNVALERMTAAEVHPSAMEAYAGAITAGKSLLVVRTTYRPLTAATIVRSLLAKLDTVDVGDVVNDHFRADRPEKAPSILDEHPLFLTLRLDRSGYEGGRVSDGLGIPLLSPRRTRGTARGRAGARSTLFWPMPLVSRKGRTRSVISGGRYMSTWFWPMPLITRKPRSKSALRGGDTPLSRILGWPTTS